MDAETSDQVPELIGRGISRAADAAISTRTFVSIAIPTHAHVLNQRLPRGRVFAYLPGFRTDMYLVNWPDWALEGIPGADVGVQPSCLTSDLAQNSPAQGLIADLAYSRVIHATHDVVAKRVAHIEDLPRGSEGARTGILQVCLSLRVGILVSRLLICFTIRARPSYHDCSWRCKGRNDEYQPACERHRYFLHVLTS